MDARRAAGPVEFVLFDLGGVLVDVDMDRAERRWADHGYDPVAFHPAFHDSGAKADGDVGRLDAEGMRRRVEEAAGRPVPMEVLLDVWGAVVRWRPWVPRLVERLAVPYGVLSNTDPVHIRALGPLPGAERLLYSFDLGATKPDRRAFEAALALVSHPPERIRYVDDRADNVAAALEVGLRAERVTDRATLEAALEGLLR
ncbi:MAG: HAD family hydrolase [Myxococcota bacterium]